MQIANKLFWIGIALLIKLMRAPRMRIPILPILNYAVDWNGLISISAHHVQQLLLRLVAVLALPESPRPTAKHRRDSGQAAVGRDHLVERWSIHEIIVNRIACLGVPRKWQLGCRRYAPSQPHLGATSSLVIFHPNAMTAVRCEFLFCYRSLRWMY